MRLNLNFLHRHRETGVPEIQKLVIARECRGEAEERGDAWEIIRENH